jgi:hypothetical protein
MINVKDMFIGIAIAIFAFFEPIEGEIKTLFLIFVLNFLAGYLSDMVANGEDFKLRKAVVCIGHAAVFFVLCAAIYAMGYFKHREVEAVQCVSLITYVVIYFYGRNILRNCKLMFREGTPPWHVVSLLDYILGVKFIDKLPYVKEYFANNKKNISADTTSVNTNH